MKTEETRVHGTAPYSGRAIMLPARIMVCEGCSRRTFYVITVEGHTHLQCTECGRSYCERGGDQCNAKQVFGK